MVVGVILFGRDDLWLETSSLDWPEEGSEPEESPWTRPFVALALGT